MNNSLVRQLSVLFTFTLLVQFSFAQRAKDGDYNASSANTIVNSYTFLTNNASSGSTAINVNDNALNGGIFGSSLAAGDLILIIQMQGADINCDVWPHEHGWGSYTLPSPFLWSNDYKEHVEAWGAITNYNNAGKYERVEVLSVSGANTINLQCGLKNNYTASGHVQIVRIPRFNNLVVSGGVNSIIPTLWNGQTGGIVAIEVETSININAGSSISASGFGFRAGQLDGAGNSGNPATPDELRFFGSSDASQGSEKGESILGFYPELNALYSRYGISAPANGGGGGGYQNCGGGGGSNIGSGYYTGNGVPDPAYNSVWALDISNPPNPNPSDGTLDFVGFTNISGVNSPGGGRGGYALSDTDQNELTVGPNNSSWGGDARKTNGGRGGHPLTYDATRLFFGGAGGAGGKGGGIVYITCYGTVTGAGAVSVNGQNGQNTNPNNLAADFGSPRRGNDGAGGGGAAGSIFFENVNAIPASISFNAIGGNGGNQVLTFAFSMNSEASGPGGSGTGGSIAFSSGTPTQNINAGSNGVTDSDHMVNFPPNGATNGASGVGSLPSSIFDLTALGVTICTGATANLTANVVGTMPTGGTINWYSQQFGGSVLGTGTNFTTPILTANTTYYVGVCPGTFRIPVVVTVSGSINLTITNPPGVCAPGTVDLTSASVTVGSDVGTLTYWTNATATTALANPSMVAISGTYYIQLEIGAGCADIQPVVVSVLPGENANFNMTATCDGGTASVTGTSGGTFTFNVAPSDAAIINASSGAITGGTSGTAYDVLYTTSGVCSASSVISVTAYSVTYTATITDENCGAGDGQIVFIAADGDGGPYQYSITGNAPYVSSGTFTSLSAGNFSVSILDNSGCEITGTESVSGIGGPSIDNLSVTNPTCNGDCDGQIVATVSGGTSPYTYQWFDALTNPIGTNAATITGLCAGNYSLEVTDASGGTTVIFTENYGTDASSCDSQGTLASGYNSGVGAWTITNTGTNDPDANLWYVSTMEAGVGTGNCGTTCSAANLSRTLHISNPVIPAFGLAADQGAAYNAGGLCPSFFCVDTDVRAESPVISLSGTGMTMTFDYIHLGDGADQCELLYFDGTIWNSLGVLPNTSVGACIGGQHLWAQYTWAIPTVLNGLPNFQVGFRWTNNDDGVGADPSVAIDNIQISYAGGASCSSNANTTLVDPAPLNLIITNPSTVCSPSTIDLTLALVTVGSDAGTLSYWSDVAATTALATPNSISASGTYYIQLDNGTCTVVEPVVVTINPIPNLTITNPTAICSPGTVDLTLAAVTVGSDVGTLTYWSDAAATITLAAPNSISASGTYYIQLDNGTCTVVQAVVVTVNPTPILTITDPTAVCSPLTVDLTSASVTVGSDVGTLTYWTDAAATITLVNPNMVSVSGTYYVQLDNGTCTIVQPVVASVSPAPNLTITDPVTVCSPGTIDITLASVTTGSDVGALTYWSDASATITLSGANSISTSGTYFIQLDVSGCTSIQPVNVTINPSPTISGVNAVCLGMTTQLFGTGVPDVVTPWSSSDATIATVDNTGLVTGVAAGSVTITYLTSNGCNSTISVIVSSSFTPIFTPIANVCQNDVAPVLPTTSTNGIIGVWLPIVSTSTIGTTTYTFTPNLGQCATSTTIDITIDAPVLPTFTVIANVCQNDVAPILPTTSLNSYTGVWSPVVSTSVVGTVTYTFTPTSGQCATIATLDVTVDAPVLPTFTAISSVCQNASAPVLSTTSLNGYAGTWSPAVSTATIGTTTYTFTPTIGQCASIATMDILVTTPITPTFTPIPDVCLNDIAPVLAVSSLNGINGTWSPIVSTSTLGVSTYTFTPSVGQCSSTATIDINVVGAPVLDVIADVSECGSYTLQTITGTNLTGSQTYYNDSQANGGTVVSGVINSTQTIWVYDGNNSCSDELSFVVTINAVPTISNFTGGGNYCTGDIIGNVVVSMNGSPSWTLDYSLDGVAQTITSSTSPIVIGNAEGVYQLITLTDADCTTPIVGTQSIKITPTPLAPVVSANAEYCSTGNIDFMIAEGNTSGTLYWYSDAALTNLIGSGQAETPNNNIGVTTYYVIDDVDGCRGPSSSVDITIVDCEIIIPTAFTPDNDGNNDTWEIPGLDDRHPNNIVRVYNRWGNLIYEHISSVGNPYSMNEWDGTFKGEIMPVASYFFIIDANENGDDVLKGSVSIILNK